MQKRTVVFGLAARSVKAGAIWYVEWGDIWKGGTVTATVCLRV